MSKTKVNNPYIFTINRNVIFSNNNKKDVMVSPSGWSLHCYNNSTPFSFFYCPGPKGRILTAYVKTRSMSESFTFESEEEGASFLVVPRLSSGNVIVKIESITKGFSCSSGDLDLTITIRY